MRSSVPAAVQIREVCAVKLGKRNADAAFISMFLSAESGVLRALGTEQVRQVLRTVPSNCIICDADERAAEMFRIVFRSKELSPTYIIAGC